MVFERNIYSYENNLINYWYHQYIIRINEFVFIESMTPGCKPDDTVEWKIYSKSENAIDSLWCWVVHATKDFRGFYPKFVPIY